MLEVDMLAQADADRAMREWLYRDPTPRVKLGSDAHKQMFCEMLLATHNPYKPAVLDWPKLSPETLHRITSLPIWDIAVQTEGRASMAVATYASTVRDPLLREALDMDAAEEARHKVVLSKLVQTYEIALAPEPPYPAPKDPEWAWLRTGYSECIDSFFAFGLFEAANQSGLFPAELVETFEPVIQEEARHILFFANWVAWYWRNLRWWKRPWFFLRVVAVWIYLIYERIGIAKGIDAEGAAQDANFAVKADDLVGAEISLAKMIDMCLAENTRRMAGYDARLLRPTTVPAIARLARRLLK
jgi:hypothetical protein